MRLRCFTVIQHVLSLFLLSLQPEIESPGLQKEQVVSEFTSSLQRYLCAISLILLGIVPVGLRAQFDSATLTGVVSDPAGAVVSNASVKVLNEATNTEVSAMTDENGRYTFVGLRPGTYRLTASSTVQRSTRPA